MLLVSDKSDDVLLFLRAVANRFGGGNDGSVYPGRDDVSCQVAVSLAESEQEGRAFALVAAERDMPFVQFHKAAGEKQTDAAACLFGVDGIFGTVEVGEDITLCFARDTYTVVLHYYGYFLVVLFSFDGDFSACGSIFHCVREKVVEDFIRFVLVHP